MLYKKRILGPALLLITAILWGLTFVSQKMGSDYVEPYTFNAGRFLISGVLMLPIYLITSIFFIQTKFDLLILNAVLIHLMH